MMKADIRHLLARFGVMPGSACYIYTSQAIEIAMEQRGFLMVTKDVYPAVAHNCRTNWQCVERGIRRASEKAWETDAELLCDIAGCRMERRPAVAEFLGLLTAYLKEQQEELAEREKREILKAQSFDI